MSGEAGDGGSSGGGSSGADGHGDHKSSMELVIALGRLEQRVIKFIHNAQRTVDLLGTLPAAEEHDDANDDLEELVREQLAILTVRCCPFYLPLCECPVQQFLVLHCVRTREHSGILVSLHFTRNGMDDSCGLCGTSVRDPATRSGPRPGAAEARAHPR